MREDVGSGYESLSRAVESFIKFDRLPPELNISEWDEGDGIAATLARNKAWHKKSRNTLHPSTLERLYKRQTISESASEISQVNLFSEKSNIKMPRLSRSANIISELKNVCFFAKKVMKVMTAYVKL